MGIVDITTPQESKAANYKDQRELANQWDNFASNMRGISKGEFNIFFIDVEIIPRNSSTQLAIKGFKQITNYWAGPASALIKPKFRYTEYTAVETIIGLNIKSFTIFKNNPIRSTISKLLGLHYPLNTEYFLSSKDKDLVKKIKAFWDQTKIYRYTDYYMNITYNQNSGRLKMKFYKMLSNTNDLQNLTKDFRKLVDTLYNCA